MSGLVAANLTWDDAGRPFAPLYGDIYGSREGAWDQARHVFLGGNRLAERFAELAPGAFFTVGETGFGTGLNFLAAWRLFAESAPAGARLHFLSVEKHPLGVADVRRALEACPELRGAAEVEALLAQWPPPLAGTHRLVFALPGGRGIHLTLLHGEAAQAMAGAHAGRGVDAWFFDGFSPQKNPAMWGAEVFAQAARLSAPGATFATWTVGEVVRQGLSAAGFAWERRPGFGKKMEMLGGGLEHAITGARMPSSANVQAGLDGPLGRGISRDIPAGGIEPPAGSAGEGTRAPVSATPKHVLILGAGIAGSAAARAFAARGAQVILRDPRGVGAHSSGNAQGIVQPMLSGLGTLEGEWARAAFFFAVRRLAQLAPDLWHPTGTLWLRDAKNTELFRRRVKKLDWPVPLLHEVTAEEASAIAGMPMPGPATHCPAAGWVAPAKLCQRLAEHPGITVEQGESGVSEEGFDLVILAAGDKTPDLLKKRAPEVPTLQLVPVRGQTVQVPAVPASAPLRCVLHAGHYLVPAAEGFHTLGATHQSGDLDPACRAADDRELLEGVAAALPALAGAWPQGGAGQRVGWRCHAPDRLPVVGAVPGHPRLAVMAALGPRGISLALLMAELLAAQAFGEPWPVPQTLGEAARAGR